MYAIIEDSGTQIKVSEGDVIDIDLRPVKDNAKALSFDRVLALGDATSENEPTIGTPYVDGASVSATIINEVKGEKLTVFKYKRRKGSRTKTGHRQRYLRVQIDTIAS